MTLRQKVERNRSAAVAREFDSKPGHSYAQAVLARKKILERLGKEDPGFVAVLVTEEGRITDRIRRIREGMPQGAMLRCNSVSIACAGGDSLRLYLILDHATEKTVLMGERIDVAVVGPIPTEFLEDAFRYYKAELNRSSRP